MTKAAVWEYEAYDTAIEFSPSGECTMSFRTRSGSGLIRMDEIVFEGLVKKARQVLDAGLPPPTP